MCADRAYRRSLGAHYDVAAVAAFPHLDFALLEHGGGFHVLEECAVAFFVALFDSGDHAELVGKGLEAFGFGGGSLMKDEGISVRCIKD